MALTADIMVRFDETNPSHYRLFNVHTVVAPAGGGPGAAGVPGAARRDGRFQISSRRRTSSYFDLVDVVGSIKTTRNDFYDINDRWLQSDWVAKRVHLRLDWAGDQAPRMARFGAGDALPAMPALPSAGEVLSERRNGESIRRNWTPCAPASRFSK
jgi:hypothetical protein